MGYTNKYNLQVQKLLKLSSFFHIKIKIKENCKTPLSRTIPQVNQDNLLVLTGFTVVDRSLLIFKQVRINTTLPRIHVECKVDQRKSNNNTGCKIQYSVVYFSQNENPGNHA